MQQVVINAAGLEKRTALLQNEKLVECAYQRPDEKPSTGSIYKGKVQKVLPGMQAVFVDIGTMKNGFLHRDDLPAFQMLSKEEKKKISISSLIKEGESVLVQIAKEETGDKGAKLTALLSFTGHLLVYFPYTPHIGVSKKIKESDRDVLLKWGAVQTDETEGMIIRTGCEKFPEKEMKNELKNLRKQFSETVIMAEGIKAPSLIIRPPFYYLLLEKWLSSNVEEIVVDDLDTYSRIKEYVSTYRTPFQVKLYTEKEPIFKKYGIDVELEKSLLPHVWLKNGASLYFNVTEALTVIDVNTGKFTGKKDRSKTMAETNVLAAKEIMKQLRLRNLAGMIVIDFITMQSQSDKDLILSVLKEESKRDSTTINLYGFTKMGLFELTRKKERPSLLETLTDKPRNDIMNNHQLRPETFYYELERIAMEYVYHDDEAIWLEVPPYFAEWLKNHSDKLSYIEKKYGRLFVVTPGPKNRELIVRQTGALSDLKKRFSH
ncbi:Rne/Rng family ribonuclease [Fictibacillus phosphorivorans]|uniref:Rne/Rng family ribonuclease n=1 Tax=Fictibacillus phosphorivorans TaxID=1221500 RepID=UPI00203D5AAB|nr:Rne/Rng family ribonuclease [Fictibacillus phosphorivorans]MCM3717005.1 Rne/Rng family ribonuclease [Fictibacillus phosphorivorans]MCM3774446.1 Rne/Rng family ribonuclease [Fictibacillus phosphorivorans]